MDGRKEAIVMRVLIIYGLIGYKFDSRSMKMTIQESAPATASIYLQRTPSSFDGDGIVEKKEKGKLLN